MTLNELRDMIDKAIEAGQNNGFPDIGDAEITSQITGFGEMEFDIFFADYLGHPRIIARVTED